MRNIRKHRKNRTPRAIKAMRDGDSIVGAVAGYYLVLPQTLERHFIASTFSLAVHKLEACCSKHLTDDAPDYWVDRSIGLLVDGSPGWINLDHKDLLLDADTIY